jgi:hypothetical protein
MGTAIENEKKMLTTNQNGNNQSKCVGMIKIGTSKENVIKMRTTN